MTHNNTPAPSGDETRDRAAAADWIAERAEGENTSTDIDGTATTDDAATPPNPDAYGHAETDTLEAENHRPASRDYPSPDPHGGITAADRRS
jgi:hypothetical protein